MRLLLLLLLLLFLLGGCLPLTAGPEDLPPPLPGIPVLYVKSGCPYCRQAFEYLLDRGVTPVLHDVLVERKALREVAALTRRDHPGLEPLVPLLLLDGRSVRGFDPAAFEALLQGGASGAAPQEGCTP